jgi:hypothetical protein
MLGMTPPEAAAFLNAWAEELFAGGAPEARRRPRPATGTDVLLFWLPSAAVDDITTLAIDPPPAAVRRAFLVRVDLGPSL